MMKQPELRRFLVTRTGPNSFVNKYVDNCRNCDGSGILTVEPGVMKLCPICEGSGYVNITKVIDIIIKPFNQN